MMSQWSKIKNENKRKAFEEKLDITQEDISIGKIFGTTYYKKGTKPYKGVLIIPGFAGNRHAFGVFAERLAECGYFCLSIDPPSHFFNTNNLTLGELSETITEGVSLLKKRYEMREVVIVGHSLGSIGALLSNAGYNKKIEHEIYNCWEELIRIIENYAKKTDHSLDERLDFEKQIEVRYSNLKSIILESLKNGIVNHTSVTCYILLSPPLSVRSTVPGLKILRHLNKKWVKKIVETLLHKPMINANYAEGNPGKHTTNTNPEVTEVQFFKSSNVLEFMEYLLNMKEATDFIKIIEDISQFSHKDDKTSFFEYYENNYIKAKPKLFVYGYLDMVLRGFLPSKRKALEKFYRSYGNAEIYHGNFSHLINENTKQQVGFMVMKNKMITEKIMKFLEKHT